MPTQCGKCLSTNLTYLEDGSALCGACEGISFPAWARKPEPVRTLPASFGVASPIGGPASPVFVPSPYPSAHPRSFEVPPQFRPVRWGAAFGYGLLAAFAGGVVWGLIAAATGSIFGLVAIIIGALVAWAMRKGAGRVTIGVIAVAAILAVFAVFVGEIVAFSIFIAPLGGTPLDVIVFYPQIVAESPGDTLFAYFFGLFGVAAASRYLWRELQVQKAGRPAPTTFVTAPPGSFAQATSVEGIRVDLLERKRTRVTARVSVGPPEPHMIDFSFESLMGTARVTLDGRPFEKTRVWGREKIVEVPIGGQPPRTVSARFWGTVRPQIDVRVGSTLLATC